MDNGKNAHAVNQEAPSKLELSCVHTDSNGFSAAHPLLAFPGLICKLRQDTVAVNEVRNKDVDPLEKLQAS